MQILKNCPSKIFFFFNDTATTEIYTLSLHDALPIFAVGGVIALYLAVTLTAAIRNEEAFLRRTFGDRYDRYRRGRPGVDAVAADAHRRFSLAQATANREHRALVGLAVAVLLLVLKATYNELFWQAAAGHQ